MNVLFVLGEHNFTNFIKNEIIIKINNTFTYSKNLNKQYKLYKFIKLFMAHSLRNAKLDSIIFCKITCFNYWLCG